ncbi:CYC02 protein-like [Coffea arabica]|uniref:CYC02 protein-like n=1 Tax=Coffea arabica TaxID=13443 RepID=A0A6P6TMT5_COFAR|nr:CYC02 protein-like [Coffea arabica]XP_027079814.1 CYC02 protein-like [Coffea arabica]
MASSKNLPFLIGVLFALVLLISSDATAADQKSVKTTGVHDSSSGEDRCTYGCCHWYNGHCQRCCPPAEETCRYGCCYWYNGHCQRCCPPAEETCRHGCCYWYNGHCQRCC